ncbi:MAG: hypothetical protein HS104_12205 [Polyangiaceae bacterium]|nr:hypothetical protein [Polyangiaceae bacterium]MCL4751722.1 hypothetical protein [Myxococcales bacterium]
MLTTLSALVVAPVAALLGAAGFFWDSPIFANDTWSRLMNGLRIGLTLGGALLLIYEVRARRLGEAVPLRTRKRVAIVLTVLSFGAYFDFFNPNVRYPEYYHRHEFYHYYLGSKYSQELSYTRLYECSAIAEIELGRGAEVRKREIRDLRVNLIKPVSDTFVVTDPSQCKKHFSAAKWEAFKKDVNWFWSTARGSYWENMMKDHGYNPPPVWTMTGKFFGSFGVAGDGFFKLLSAIDVLFHIGVVLLLYWAFGWRIGALATVFWGCNAPANFYWTGGAFLRQDWFFFLVASLALARKRKFFLAGFALTWSSLLRVFPMIFFAGWAIIIVFHVLQEIRARRAGSGNGEGLMGLLHPDHRKLLAGCIIASATLIPASVIVAGGDSYKEFVSHTLKTHNNTPLTNHMGLETMLVHDWDGRMRFTRDDNLDDPFQGWKQGRIDRHKQRKWAHVAIIGALFLWTAWALRRTKALWIGQALAAPLVMSMTNLTCYYYSMFILCAALAKARRPLGPVVLVTSGASQILLLSYYWVDDKFTAQAWLFGIFSLVLLWGYSRPFSMERLTAWWNGKPEPKAKTPDPPPLPAE